MLEHKGTCQEEGLFFSVLQLRHAIYETIRGRGLLLLSVDSRGVCSFRLMQEDWSEV